MFERRIIKLGPSRAIIIGKQLCEYFGLEAGDTVEVEGLRKVSEKLKLNKIEGERIERKQRTG